MSALLQIGTRILLRRLLTLCALALGLVSPGFLGCVVDGQPTPDPSPSPTLEPTPTPGAALLLGAAMPASLEQLPVSSASSALALDAHQLLWSDGLDLYFHQPWQAADVQLGQAVGDLSSAVQLADGTLLVATTRGLFVSSGDPSLESSILEHSALEEKLPSSTSLRLALGRAEDEDQVWIRGEGFLARFSAGILSQLKLEGALSPPAELVAAAPADLEAALWLVGSDGVYGLTMGETAGWWLERASRRVDGLGIDVLGQLWLVGEGRLERRDLHGRWQDLLLPFTVRGLAVQSAMTGLWLSSSEGPHWLEGEMLSPVSGLEDGELGLADAQGRVLRARAGDLERLVLGRPLFYSGLAAFESVESSLSIYLLPTLPEQVVTLQAELDGLSLEPVALEGGRAWALNIPYDGAAVERSLNTRTRYTDQAEELEQSLTFFSGAPPTWSGDIQPLYQEWCSTCHQPGGSASNVITLDRYETWREQVELILLRVTCEPDCVMPPYGALDPSLVVRIEAWQEGGFQLE